MVIMFIDCILLDMCTIIQKIVMHIMSLYNLLCDIFSKLLKINTNIGLS
jgi:hypothetical protein